MNSKEKISSASKTLQGSSLKKALTGIRGLDELTDGGLPKGRPTLLCGGAGCGKTLMAMEFLVHGAEEFGEPGVFMSFEESIEELATDFYSLGHDLNSLIAQKKIVLDSVRIERSESIGSGDYDLEGLFIRLGSAIDAISAKRVVLDTIETLFSGLPNPVVLRAELCRLFRWLKERGVTTIVTGEKGETSLTRFGLEEYVADCVILLDNRVDRQMATRRLRIVKYRGSTHGTNEYPFLIDEGGISIVPITSLGLRHEAGTERVSSGVPRLDAMLGGEGYYRGCSVLVSGSSGSGKTSLAAHFANAAAHRDECCLWFAYEESPSQIIRNMRSIGIDLDPAVKSGRLLFHAERPTICGLEMHQLIIHRLISQFNPRVVVLDPITNFAGLGSEAQIKAMLVWLIDFFKTQQITALFTSLAEGDTIAEPTKDAVSSLMDTWLLLRDMQSGAERNRLLHIVKSRGMFHSNQIREFLLTDHGVELRDVYIGTSGALLTGSARDALEAREKAQNIVREQEIEGKNRELGRKRDTMEARIAVLQAEFEVERTESMKTIGQDQTRAGILATDRVQMAKRRQADAAARKTPPRS